MCFLKNKDSFVYVMSRGANRMGWGFHSTNVLFNNLLWCLWPEQLCIVLQKLKDNKVRNNSQWLAGNRCCCQRCVHAAVMGVKPSSVQIFTWLQLFPLDLMLLTQDIIMLMQFGFKGIKIIDKNTLSPWCHDTHL